MNTKYGVFPDRQIQENEEDLVKQIFRLLKHREENFPDLDYYFSTLLFRIAGLNNFLNQPSELITVISLLESARIETSFKLYRKAVLDSCSIVDRLQKAR